MEFISNASIEQVKILLHSEGALWRSRDEDVLPAVEGGVDS